MMVKNASDERVFGILGFDTSWVGDLAVAVEPCLLKGFKVFGERLPIHNSQDRKLRVEGLTNQTPPHPGTSRFRRQAQPRNQQNVSLTGSYIEAFIISVLNISYYLGFYSIISRGIALSSYPQIRASP